eukprot:TRINITY_DN40134_c0_g1_i1.p1 TRINITY_DN40134_c0_g1~~TRINITY_DN40134_c0_g1_i1.p1  ORF type:complete len:435 (+),score=68.07 TRINITY_DN40134_c0_g1_i1:29-1306(+)
MDLFFSCSWPIEWCIHDQFHFQSWRNEKECLQHGSQNLDDFKSLSKIRIYNQRQRHSKLVLPAVFIWLCAHCFGVASAQNDVSNPPPPAPRCSLALLEAVKSGDRAQVQLSLALNESVYCVNDMRETPLHIAAENGQREVALDLLAAGVFMSADNLGRGPLHLAAGSGHIEVATLLLQANAYIELKDAALRTPLHHAARFGHLNVVKLLLEDGAFIDAPDGVGRIPLHYTCRSDTLLNTTKFLIERGSNFEAEDLIGFRPLHYSCTQNQLYTSRHLLVTGSDTYAMDKAGWNPMIHAASQGFYELTDELVVWTNKPKKYPQPTGEFFVKQDIINTTTMGMPSIVFIILVACCASACVVAPSRVIVKRYQRVETPYVVNTEDEEHEAFMDNLIFFVGEAKGAQAQVIQEWNRLPIAAIADLHRVKG